MLKCCAYGIPNDPEGNVIRWTLCADDNQPCPQFAAFRSMGSWSVTDCAGCKPPTTTPQPKLKCCMYGIPRDPSGRVVRWQVCLPAKVPCPKVKGFTNLGSHSVNSCKDCCGATKSFPIKRELLSKMRAAVRNTKRSKR